MGNYDDAVVYMICNSAKHYDDESLYSNTVYDVVNDLAMNTRHNSFNYYALSNYGEVVAHGHAACNGKLSKLSCALCLGDAQDMLNDHCTDSIGAQIQLGSCRLRYENYLLSNEEHIDCADFPNVVVNKCTVPMMYQSAALPACEWGIRHDAPDFPNMASVESYECIKIVVAIAL